MAKFKVGDTIVGNSLADKKYCITRTGWKGKVIMISAVYSTIGVETLEGERSIYTVDDSHFDLVSTNQSQENTNNYEIY